ncbi:MAG: AIR synthase-related protein [Acidimicrobiales bacterium]
MSVVDAALSATSLGARALHDPTEGGSAAALHEMAAAAGVRLRLDRAA